MNPIQFAQQIKHRLEQVEWPFGSAGAVFGTHGSVAVFAGDPTEDQIPAGFPWALVGIDRGQVDEDDPGLITQQFNVVVCAESGGDPLGEHALIGGAIQQVGRSGNRGVGEIMERVREAVQSITGADGARVLLSSTSTGKPTPLGRGRHLALDELTLSAVCTSAATFSPPQQLRYSLDRWKWNGDHCTPRFDFMRYRLLRRRGRNFSATPNQGELLYTGTNTYWVGVQETGYTYTIFADYCSRGNGIVEGYSEPEVGAYRVVV